MTLPNLPLSLSLSLSQLLLLLPTSLSLSDSSKWKFKPNRKHRFKETLLKKQTCGTKMMMKLCLSPSLKMATTSTTSPNMNFPSPCFSSDIKSNPYSLPPVAGRLVLSHRSSACFAVQESSPPAAAASTVAAETKEDNAKESSEPAAPAKQNLPAKAAAKPLPELMEEDVIPSLKSTLEAQEDISELELSFGDNRLEGSFQKKGNPYSFWAFFPDGNINGPKGFSLSSYGSTVSSVEPFLVDEKKVTAKLIVFWVEKRLAAQGIIPVWTD